MRKHLVQDFTSIYHIDLHGNIRKNHQISGTTHNVFGTKVGIGITLAIRNIECKSHTLYYHRVPEYWRREQKCEWLAKIGHILDIEWHTLTPDMQCNWIISKNDQEFKTLLPLGDKLTKRSKKIIEEAILKIYSIGINTNRDAWVYNFDQNPQIQREKNY